MDWPKSNTIEFDNVSMRYKKGLDLVLKGMSFKVGSNEKVGIVGRTGAGKSSILQALFRLIEVADGVVRVDGKDVSKLGLHTLRTKLSYIPQFPFLMDSNIRDNLDPFHEFSDEKIMKTLEEV